VDFESGILGVYGPSLLFDKVSGVFVRFRAPLQYRMMQIIFTVLVTIPFWNSNKEFPSLDMPVYAI
jgi:hypothetical protein